MARIPGIQREISTVVGAPGNEADASAFGGGIGRALSGASDDIQSAATLALRTAQEEREKVNKSNIANSVAQFDYSKDFLTNQQNTAAGGAGFVDTTRRDYQEKVEGYVGKIEDPAVRQKVRDSLISSLPSYTSQAATFEKNSGAQYAKDNADKSLGTLQNQIRAEPENFEGILGKGNAVIDASPAVPANVREEYKTKFKNDLAMSRFKNLNVNAKTVDEVDGIEKDLLNPEKGWQEKMAPSDYSSMLDALKTNRSHLMTQADATARAALESVADRTKNLVPIPPEELQQTFDLAKQSKNPALLWKVTELKAQQDVLANEGRLNLEELRARVEGQAGRPGLSYPNIPSELADAINVGVARSGGAVSASYLGAVAQREYGRQLKGDADGKVNWNVTADTSSATGVYQFIDRTWLGQMNKAGGAIPKSMGINTDGMSDAQKLALRSDPKLQAVAMASFTLENKNALQTAFPGRAVTDTDLYLAHFLGSGGATTFIRAYQANPSASAAAALPDAAGANKSVFYRNGEPLSLASVYANVANSMGTQPGRVDAVRNDTRQSILADTEKRLKDDPMSLALSKGIVAANPLQSPADYATRGQAAAQAASYYNIPLTDMKPLTSEEATTASRVVKDGTADDVLAMMSKIEGMGSEMSRAAFKQIGQSDAVFGHAAGLAADQGNMQVAGDIVRGQKRLNDDKSVKDAMGSGYDNQMSDTFNQTVGASLNGLRPDALAAIRQAALAHYVQTQVGSGTAKYGSVDPKAYASSVQAVLGGNEAAPAVGSVNGAPVLLPKGVDASTMERAVDNLQPTDLITLSVDGSPPLYADGSPASPAEIGREGKFRSVGGGVYTIAMADNRQLITGVGPGGRSQFYRFKGDAPTLKAIAARGVGAAPFAGATTSSNVEDTGVGP